MKHHLLKFLNRIIAFSGFRLYKKGLDMESGIQRIINHNIKINSIIDIGASDGSWSKMAINLFPESVVLGIEPLKERVKSLQKLQRNNNNFLFTSCVAGENNNDSVLLSVTPDLNGSTVDGRNGELRNVSSRSIDSLVEEYNLSGPFLIKFDTHGFEIPILRGAKKTLNETNVIIMEVYNFRHTKNTLLFYEMCDYLNSLGFRSYDLVDPSYRPFDHSFWQMDLFFVKKNSPIFKKETYL